MLNYCKFNEFASHKIVVSDNNCLLKKSFQLSFYKSKDLNLIVRSKILLRRFMWENIEMSIRE